MKYKVTIRVVETMVPNMAEQFNTLESVAEYTAAEMLAYGAGGATINAPSTGMWRDEKGFIVKEQGQDVWTLTDTPAKFMKLAQVLRDLGGQDCILVTVEEMKAVNFV